MSSTIELVKQIKETGEDFEFYPTTEAMLRRLKAFMDKKMKRYNEVLDCGAGDGRVLKFLGVKNGYAIEKAMPLIEAMSRDILIIGRDFHQTILIDKNFDLIFSNPPYSEFEAWAARLIREANTHYLALILPSRWKKSELIKKALRERKGVQTPLILGEFDFLNAQRAARAKVDLIFIEFSNSYENDIFADYLEKEFGLNMEYKSNYQKEIEEKEAFEAEVSAVCKENLIEFLLNSYDKEMGEYVNSLRSLKTIHPKLLHALDIDKSALIKGVKKQLQDLRVKYWGILFDELYSITSRVTTHFRQFLSYRIASQTNIEFNSENIHNIVIWVVKNANHYAELSYLELFDKMAMDGNALFYKSNQRFYTDSWRYASDEKRNQPHKLDYRIVATREAITTSYHSFRNSDFEKDIICIARNLGFYANLSSQGFMAGEKGFLYYTNGKVFADFKAYKNGNVHLRLDKKFMACFSLAVARLRKWVTSKEEAKAEFKDLNDDDINAQFERPLGLNFQSSLLQLGFKAS